MMSVIAPPVAVMESPLTPTSPVFQLPPRLPLPDLRMDWFAAATERSFVNALTPELLQIMSAAILNEMNEACQNSSIGMLPSFCHTLPRGNETGHFLALDVGGSTLRVALVRLNGRHRSGEAVSILKSRHHVIDNSARNLVGKAFFSWMADRIHDTLDGDARLLHGSEALKAGLAWSFPVEQLSIRDGLLMQMGKGFHAVDGLIGANLADLVQDACTAKHLNVTVDAIVNDSSSSLLSGAYLSNSSPVALILGTGLNATVDLSVSAIARHKFGTRPAAWHAAARHVLTNAELSLYGGKVFPVTKWDRHLNKAHCKPDFQPLEYLTSGRYMGEITRLVLLDAIHDANLFGGSTPADFEPYTLTTETIAAIERDRSPSLARAASVLNAKHPLPHGKRYSTSDLAHVKHIVTLISSRAAAYIATGVYTTCELRRQHDPALASEDIVVACNGSVVEKYPDFLARTQAWLDILSSAKPHQGQIKLELTGESVLLGAAIAVACQT